MFQIKIIDEEHKQDINIPNEPFPLFGRMIPSYVNEKWQYEIAIAGEGEISEMCFPDENYDYEAMKDSCVFIGAYDGDRCVGLAIMREAMLKYMYLYDLKISREYRRQGIAGALIERAKEISREHGYRGIYTQGQDNNVAACKFYLHAGFVIGGFDSNVYKWTTQEGKSDIIFYLDC